MQKKVNLSTFIAHRWAFSVPLKHTRNILRMGIGSISLCIAVMITSLCILVGFKEEVSQKVFGFGSHLQIQPYLQDTLTQETAYSIHTSKSLLHLLSQQKYIKHSQAFAQKGALIRGEEESYGVLFKGFPKHYDTSFFSKRLKAGRMPVFLGQVTSQEDSVQKPKTMSSEILISEIIANKLGLKVGDKVRSYFTNGELLKARAFTVKGIYSTGLEKFDEAYILCDIAQIQRLNDWNTNQVDGFDLQLFQPKEREQNANALTEMLPYELSCYPCDLLFPEIFDWLALIDVNVWVLLIIMLIVTLISLVSVLFIYIIERRPQIGILKAQGAGNALIRRIFIKQTLFIMGKGILYGNVIALFLCFLQQKLHLLRLEESVYFLDSVPIKFPWLMILGVNVICLITAFLLLSLTSRILNRIHPAKIVTE
ncbi:MAG: FtsX-like permease family protein [Bacteroidales bacterium]